MLGKMGGGMRIRPMLEVVTFLVLALAGADSAVAQQNQPDDLPWLHQQAPAQTAPSTPPSQPGTVQPVPPAASTPTGPIAPGTVQPVPPYPSAPNPPLPPGNAPPPAAEIRGRALVLDTANLMVEGRQVPLFGVIGVGSPYDKQMASYIAAQGGGVDCVPRANRYVCRTTSGFDVAQAALFNGGARAAPDAPPDYLHQQDLARAAHRGVWGHRRQGSSPAI